MTHSPHSPRRGFTLIELLVVIAIIGLLASIVLASLNQARAKAQDAARIADIKSLKTALELYYTNNNGYPNTGSFGVIVNNATLVNALVPRYIPSMPAILVTDQDQYYSYNGTQNYAFLVYTAASNTYCRTGTNVQGWEWGPTYTAMCNF